MELGGIGAVVAAAGLFGTAVAVVWSSVVDRRRRDVADMYRELYEASSAKIEHLEREVAGMRARIAVLEGDLIERVAEGVAERVARIMEGRP